MPLPGRSSSLRANVLDDIGEIVPDHLPERLAELRARALSVLGALRKPDSDPWL